MALAAPLLDFLDFPSFAILLSGPSKAAKSTALVAAGSIIGIAREKDLPNFRTTDAALGELPAAFNDMAMPINELGLLKGSVNDRYGRIRDFSYGLAEGRGTTYSAFVPRDDGNCRHTWRSLVFATGEETLDQIALAAGESRSMGESIRWIDLRGTYRGAKDIFDRCPKSVSPDARVKWVRKQCKSMRKAARDNHGVTLDHYIKQVIKRRRKIPALVQPLIDEFVRRLSIKPMGRPCIISPVAWVSSVREAFLVYDWEPCPMPNGSSIAAFCDAIALRNVTCELRLNCYDRDCVGYEPSLSHRTCLKSSGRSSLALRPSKLQTATWTSRVPLQRSQSGPRSSRDGSMTRASLRLSCGGFNRRRLCPVSRPFQPSRGTQSCGRRASPSGLMAVDIVPSYSNWVLTYLTR